MAAVDMMLSDKQYWLLMAVLGENLTVCALCRASGQLHCLSACYAELGYTVFDCLRKTVQCVPFYLQEEGVMEAPAPAPNPAPAATTQPRCVPICLQQSSMAPHNRI